MQELFAQYIAEQGLKSGGNDIELTYKGLGEYLMFSAGFVSFF